MLTIWMFASDCSPTNVSIGVNSRFMARYGSKRQALTSLQMSGVKVKESCELLNPFQVTLEPVAA